MFVKNICCRKLKLFRGWHSTTVLLYYSFTNMLFAVLSVFASVCSVFLSCSNAISVIYYFTLPYHWEVWRAKKLDFLFKFVYQKSVIKKSIAMYVGVSFCYALVLLLFCCYLLFVEVFPLILYLYPNLFYTNRLMTFKPR